MTGRNYKKVVNCTPDKTGAAALLTASNFPVMEGKVIGAVKLSC